MTDPAASRPRRAARPPRLHARDGVGLPPASLRAAGKTFAEDRAFLDFARRDAATIARRRPLGGSRVLDFGCGCGRLYYGLGVPDEPAAYLGLDVREDVIRWCAAHISAGNPRFAFARLDVHNLRYNPRGRGRMTDWAGIATGRFGIVYAYSVFSHLDLGDAAEALAFFKGVLEPGGSVFLTAFVARNVPDFAINPETAGIDIAGELHVVRYSTGFWRRTLGEAGFDIVRCDRARATDGQNLYVLAAR